MIKIKNHKTYKDILIVTFPYCEEVVKKIKQIKGKKWNPEKKYWTIPNTKESIQQCKDLFGVEETDFSGISKDISLIKRLNEKDQELISRLSDKIQLKGYSRKTRKAYINEPIAKIQ